MAFNLFDTEEKVIAAAHALRHKLEQADPELRAGVEALIDAYDRGYREQRRLVRFSDRLQGQLNAANQELQRRKQELEQAMDSLVQAEKLASLGCLVAGVAHEINTPLGIALSCASHLTDSTERVHALIDHDELTEADFAAYMATATDTGRLILGNCERAAGLIRSFKQVAVDRASAERRLFRLGDYIRETLTSLAPRLRQAKVVVDCPDDLEIDGTPGALSQVVTNLVLNSLIHAYDEGDTGTLGFSVSCPDADTVRIVYSDDGKGMAADILPRCFEPFVTTRRGRGGTGLGLHIVYNLVTGPLQGSIAVDSAPAAGTRFAITMPRIPR